MATASCNGPGFSALHGHLNSFQVNTKRPAYGLVGQ